MADREYRVIYKAVADFADLIKQSKLAEDRLRAMQGAQEVDRKSLRDLDKYTDAVEEVGKAAADATDSLGDLREEQDKGTESSKQATKARKQEATAMRDVARAEAEATRAAQSSNKTSAERIRLLLEQKRAQAEMRAGLEKMPRAWGRDEDAAKESARATRDASQATDTHVKKVLSLRTALKYLTADMVSFREEQEKVSEETDRDTNVFSRMAQAILHVGRSSDDSSGALHRMTTKLRDLNGGTEDTRSALGKLGQGIRDLASVFRGLGMPSLLMYASGTVVRGVYALAGAVTVAVQALAQLGPLLAAAPGGILAIAQAALGAKVAIGEVTNAMKLYQSEQKKEGPQTFAEALKEMSPATRQFTKDLVKLTDQWGKVKKGVSQAFFSQFVKDMDKVKSLIPTVSALLERGAASAGKFVDKAIKQFSSPVWKDALDALSKSGARTMDSLGDALLAVANGFRKIAMAARPLTEWLGGEFKGLAKDFNDWADHLGGDSFQNAQTRFSQFVLIFKNLGSIISSTFKAAGDTTDWFMKRFTEMTTSWATTTKMAAQDGGGLKAFFDNLKPVMSETARLFGDLFRGLNKFADPTSLAKLVSILRTEMLPALLTIMEAWGNTNAAEKFVTVLSEMAQLFARLSEAGFFNQFITLVGVVGSLIGALNDLLSNPVVKWFTDIAGAVFPLVSVVLFLNKAVTVLGMGLTYASGAMGRFGLAGAAAGTAAGTLGKALTALSGPVGWLIMAIGVVGVKAFDSLRNAMSSNIITAGNLVKTFQSTGQAFVDQQFATKKPWWLDPLQVDKSTGSLASLAKYADRSLWDSFNEILNPDVESSGNKIVDWTNKVTNAFDGVFHSFFKWGEIEGKTDAFNKQLEQFTAGVQDLVATNPEAAIEQVVALREALTDAGWDPARIDEVLGPLENMVGITKEGAVAALEHAKATEELTAAQQRYNDILERGTGAMEAQAAIDDYQASLDAADEALKRNGKTLDAHTPKGRENRAMLRGLAQDTKTMWKEADLSTKQMKRSRDEFIKVAVAMGKTPAQAKKMADSFGLLPGPASKAAKEAKQAIIGQIKETVDQMTAIINAIDLSIKAGVDVTITGDTSGRQRKDNLRRGDAPGVTKTAATGGWVRGPGSTTSDSIPAWLSDQEYVIQAAAVQKYGVGFFDAINAMRYSDGGIIGYKIGGKVKKGSKSQVQAKGKAKGMSIPTDVVEGVQKRREEFQSAKAAALDNKNELAQARENLRNAQQALAEATDKEAQQLRIDESAKNLRNAEAELAEAEYDLANGISVKAAELERDEAYAAYQSALEDQTNRISVGRAEVDLKQAQESAADALEDFENNISVGAAQVNLAQAEEEYRQALFDAATGLSVRGAQADVNSAEENYRKVMASAASSEAEKMQARQALEEARAQVADTAMQTELRLMEAQQGRVEAEDMLGDTEAEVALRVLETAQAQKEAEQNLTDTQREVDLRVRETAQTYDASVRNVATVGREVQNRVIEARTGLVEARRADRLLPGQIAEEERQARLGLSQAESGLKDTKVQNRKDNETWNEQLTKYGKRDAAAGFTKKNWKAYKASVPSGQKATNKGFGKWLKKNGPYAKDKFGDVGVFNSATAERESWADYREEKSLYKDVNGSIEAPSTNMEALANYMEGRVGDEVGADTCLANVHKALDDVGARLGLGSANNTASTSGRASDVREWLQSKGLLRDGEPPRGAILVWMDRNHIAIADGHGNAINNWGGSKVEKTPLSKMGSYKWTYPASLWTGNQGRRVGGTVKANQPYTVGEVGQELFVPDVNGRIMTAAQTARLLAAATSSSGFGVSMGLPGMNPNLPGISVPSVSSTSIEAVAGGSRFGDIHVHNPVPERASDSIQKRIKVLTSREA